MLPELVTTKGEHFKHVTITSQTLDTVTVMHDSGVATISWSDIPAEAQRSFGFDAAKADALKKEQAAAHAAATPPAVQLTPLASKYRQQLEALISQKEVRPVTDLRKAAEYVNTSNQLVLKMSKHAELIMSKWMDVAGQLSSSGLGDAGLQRVFLKQFTQEDTLSNTDLVNGARVVKGQLSADPVDGVERLNVSLTALFSAYASLCERDRTPSAEPADFIRDLRVKHEFFGAAYLVFVYQLKACSDRMTTLATKP
jgi:hypothetical protein